MSLKNHADFEGRAEDLNNPPVNSSSDNTPKNTSHTLGSYLRDPSFSTPDAKIKTLGKSLLYS